MDNRTVDAALSSLPVGDEVTRAAERLLLGHRRKVDIEAVCRAILAGQGAAVLTAAIDELIAGVAEIGCVYGGDLPAPQITGREEVIDGLRELRRLTAGAK